MTDVIPFIFRHRAMWVVKFLFIGKGTWPGLGGTHKVCIDCSSIVMLMTLNLALSQFTKSPLNICLQINIEIDEA